MPDTIPPATSVRRPLIRPGRNCWRIARAERAALVMDDGYYRAVHAALSRARRSIRIIAWDIAEQETFRDGSAMTLGDVLRTAVAANPLLRVDILVWGKAAFLNLRRGRLPLAQKLSLEHRRSSHGRIRYVLDNSHPPFAAHHQKIVVIDDRLAFCGGFDLAGNRWDTRRHLPRDPRRREPDGDPYPPHHDLMLMMDGEAARALGDLARDRWRTATGEAADPADGRDGPDPWPPGLRPDFRDVDVAIARTMPAWAGRPEVREVEASYLDAIAAARDCLYLESQYFASYRIADALAARLAEPEGPEVIVINPKRAPSFQEQLVMDNARTEIVDRLLRADRFDRFRILAAVADGEEEIIVHSKAMVMDDRLLRIGSANLNGRSMGTDTECDVMIEAVPGLPGSDIVAAGITALRDRMVAAHLNVLPGQVRAAVERTGSLVRAIDMLRRKPGQTLVGFSRPRPTAWAALSRYTDPEHPPLEAAYDAVIPRELQGWPRTGRLAGVGALLGIGTAVLAMIGRR